MLRQIITNNRTWSLSTLRAILALSGATVLLPSIAQDLPAGVPRAVSPDGRDVYVPHTFTTKAYEQEAFRLLVHEANLVAEELKLPEQIPITEGDVTAKFICPFGYSYMMGGIGRITTPKYTYAAVHTNKFSDLTVAEYDGTCFRLMDKGKLPLARLDTKTPYLLATQWLAAVAVDVNGLNRDCESHVAVSPFWNGLAKLGQKPQGPFVPIYSVWWTSARNKAEGGGSTAYVELFLPGKTLIKLSIQDSKYIQRKPLVFTNLSALFPGTATIVTNRPAKPVPGRPPDPG